MAVATNKAYRGALMLLKVSDGASPPVYTTMMGVRTRDVTVNNAAVDITDSDNAPYRALLENAGVRTLTITASGIFKDDTAFRAAQTYAHTGVLESYLLVFGNNDTIEGTFLITSLAEAGTYNGEQTFTMTLESSGHWNFARG